MKIALKLFMVIAIFTFGATFGHYKYYPYTLMQGLKLSLTNGLARKPKNFQSCSLPITSNLEENSHLFIGHSAGSPLTAKYDDFIAPNVLNLIKKYGDKFKSITFTGDVFYIPSLSKWEKLENLKILNQEFFISPGNHDIDRPDSKDVFKLSPFGKKDYPFINTLHNFPIVIDDSIGSNWSVSDKTILMINQLESEKVFIARHNVPVSDLLTFANSDVAMSPELDNVENFVLDFDKNVDYFWIIGDGGKYKRLPRLTCAKYKNHTFLINGVGELEGDSVIILNKGKLYQYIL